MATWLSLLSITVVLLSHFSHGFIVYIEQRYPGLSLSILVDDAKQMSSTYRKGIEVIREVISGAFVEIDSSHLMTLNRIVRPFNDSHPASTPLPAALPQAMLISTTDLSKAVSTSDIPHPPKARDLTPTPVESDTGAEVVPKAVAASTPVPGAAKPLPKLDSGLLARVIKENETFLFAGDSLMQGVAPHVRRVLCGNRKTRCDDLSKPSSGLSQTSFHDWPGAIRQAFAKQSYSAVFVFMGANDPWDFIDQKQRVRYGSHEWKRIYEERARSIAISAREAGAELYWVGLPSMRPPRLKVATAVQNEVFAKVTTEEGGRYIPPHGLVDDGGDEFIPSIRTDDGRRVVVRLDDGVHFTIAGQKRIADAILANVLDLRSKVSVEPGDSTTSVEAGSGESL